MKARIPVAPRPDGGRARQKPAKAGVLDRRRQDARLMDVRVLRHRAVLRPRLGQRAGNSPKAPGHYQLLDLGDRLGRVEVLGTGVGAVHDGVAAVEPEGILWKIQGDKVVGYIWECVANVHVLCY